MITYDKARQLWDSKLLKNEKYKKLIHKLNFNEGATPEDVHQLAIVYSETLADTLDEIITPDTLVNGKVSADFGNNVISKLMHLLHDRVQADSFTLQRQVNQKKNLGIQPVVADYNAGRVEGLLNRLIAELYPTIKWIIEQPVVENLALNTIDEFCQKNLERAAKAGVPMGLRRVLQHSKATCKWCESLAGDYEYPAPRDVYKRHVNCRCVTYTIYPKGIQDVWSKQVYEQEPNGNVLGDIRNRNRDRDKLKGKQAAYRQARQDEIDNAKTMRQLIDLGKKYGYENPNGWAWHIYNSRK